jgi:hypothetical protein
MTVNYVRIPVVRGQRDADGLIPPPPQEDRDVIAKAQSGVSGGAIYAPLHEGVISAPLHVISPSLRNYRRLRSGFRTKVRVARGGN